ATRAGTTTARFWAEAPQGQDDAACTYANVFDQNNEARIKATSGGITWEAFKCSDEFAFTAPADAFKPNPWGLYNTLVNVWEWVQDCYHDTYQGAPENGSAFADGTECASTRRAVRGGSWGNRPQNVRSADRARNEPAARNNTVGFRLAQD
ncbi:MAG: formylglycine-generating enzyme family protein, partial [Candidatus Methylumidiphilus sp.]